MPPAVEMWGLNHWTPREVLRGQFWPLHFLPGTCHPLQVDSARPSFPRTENENAEISLQEGDAGSCFQCPIISHQHGGQDKVMLFKGRGRRCQSHAVLAGSKCGGRGGVGKSFVVGVLCPLGGREASSPLPALSSAAFSEEY